MYINGKWVTAGSARVFDVFNPANGEKIGEVPDGSSEGLSEYLETKLGGFSIEPAL